MDPFLIIIFISSVLLIFGVKQWQKNSNLLQNGIKATAVIYRNNYKGFPKNEGIYFPVVRFLTKEKEWITQELDIGQNPPIEEGKKVTVIYDPEEPTLVDIYSNTRLELLPRIITAIATGGIVVGLLGYAELIDF